MIMTVFLGCLVGVVVVAQTLYTSTMEHIKEFATVKAIGGGNAEIYGIIAKQAAIAACGWFRSRGAHGLRPPPDHGRDRPEVDPDPDSLRRCLRRNARALPFGLRDLVPKGGLARPGPRLPGLTAGRIRSSPHVLSRRPERPRIKRARVLRPYRHIDSTGRNSPFQKGSDMKIHAIQTGTVQVKASQRVGRGQFRVLTVLIHQERTGTPATHRRAQTAYP